MKESTISGILFIIAGNILFGSVPFMESIFPIPLINPEILKVIFGIGGLYLFFYGILKITKK